MALQEDFTKGQEAIIEQIAYKVGDSIANRIEEKIKGEIQYHQATCQTVKAMENIRGQLSAGTKIMLVIAWIFNMAIAVYAAVASNAK